jgi:hypothetical protein
MSSVCQTILSPNSGHLLNVYSKTWRNKKSFIGLLMSIIIFTKYTLSLIWDFTIHRKDGDKRMKGCRTFVQIFTLS